MVVVGPAGASEGFVGCNVLMPVSGWRHPRCSQRTGLGATARRKHVWMFGAAGAPHAESMARWGPDPEKGHRVGRQSSLRRPPPNSDLLAPSAVPLPPLTSVPRTVLRDPAA
ncbi:hypothetical protein TcCL_Unassigned01726 [Trypanosoma cruzi]|nr:hypothetical protein TcCL_Unassigned01726 [Trypanosoma cruzi]